MSYQSAFFLGAALSFVVTSAVAMVDDWSSMAAIITVMILLTGTFLGAIWIGRLVQDRLPRVAPLGIVFVAVAYLGAAGLVGWVGHANGQRCVDTDTMTVADSSHCQGTTANDGGEFAWYYGGAGTADGDTVTGGSFTAPSDGDNGGTGGAGVDSSGGDEGGADVGGGESGGEG
jgi:uncharacterized membrane protein YgcG